MASRRLSLRGRMLLVAALVLFLFLSMMGAVLDQAFRQSAADGVSERLLLHIYGLLATTEENDGVLFLPEVLQEPDFNRLGTGLYALVLDAQGRELWRSESALDLSVPPQSKVELYNATIAGEPRFGYVLNDAGNRLFFLSYRVLWQGASDTGTPYIFSVLQTRDPYLSEVRGFRNNLWGWLVGVVLVLIVVQALVMSWGLAPLRRLEADLAQIEDGKQDYLEGDYPLEIEGVTRNLNLLLSSERQQRERYRTTLADLAHSLKTPLAILQGATSSLVDRRGSAGSDSEIDRLDDVRQTVDEQVTRMNEIVAYQLERAVSTSSNLIGKSIGVAPILTRLVEAMRKVYQSRNINISLEISECEFFGDERDLMELLGNVIDNACKYGGGNVLVSASHDGSELLLIVEDDGVGISEPDRERVLARGARLDSREAGQGIGLAVVVEIVGRYGGKVAIEASSKGGARVVVRLPA